MSLGLSLKPKINHYAGSVITLFFGNLTLSRAQRIYGKEKNKNTALFCAVTGGVVGVYDSSIVRFAVPAPHRACHFTGMGNGNYSLSIQLSFTGYELTVSWFYLNK